MGIFDALGDYCREQTLREFELPVHKIEAIIGHKLPESALRPQYFANVVDGGGPVRSSVRQTPYDTFRSRARAKFGLSVANLRPASCSHYLDVLSLNPAPWVDLQTKQ